MPNLSPTSSTQQRTDEATVEQREPSSRESTSLFGKLKPRKAAAAVEPQERSTRFSLFGRKTDRSFTSTSRIRGTQVGTDSSLPKKAPRNTREVIGFKAMLPSGIAWLGADEWSATLRLDDISYQSAAATVQEDILDKWARFLNSFGGGARAQINVINRAVQTTTLIDGATSQLRGDGFDDLRADLNEVVAQKITQSAATVTEKFLTVTIHEADEARASSTLDRLVRELQAQLLAIDGCRSAQLTRTERLELISELLRPGQLFTFDETTFDQSTRLSALDYVAPGSITRSPSATGPLILNNQGENTYHASIWVRDYPAWLSDRLVADLTDMKTPLTFSLHLEPYDQVDGTHTLNRQIAALEMQQVAEERKATKAGYRADMVPHGLKVATDEAKTMRAELEQSNQKMFSTVLVVGVSAPTAEQLDQAVKQAMTTLRRNSLQAELIGHMQLDALTTELPLGLRRIPMRRTLTTASTAIMLPFTTQELFQPGGTWYGLNAKSGRPVVADRRLTRNSNGFILGTTGSGKSYCAKHEITEVLLNHPDDDVIIIDPEREYARIAEAFQGAIVRLHAGSPQMINALDIALDVDQDEDPLLAKADKVLAMMGTLIGGVHGLDPTRRSILDRTTLDVFRRYAAEHRAGNDPLQPTLRDLQTALYALDDPEAKAIATALEIYTNGSLSTFSQQTNVDLSNRLIVWDLARIGSELRTFGLMVVMDQVWTRIARNRQEGRRTHLYMDEFHLLFADVYAAHSFKALYQRARKWGALPTGITQNIEELLAHADARLMLANSDFLMLFGQSDTDALSLQNLLRLSEDQVSSFMRVPPGCGLLRMGSATVPVDGRFPDHSLLHKLYTTKFGE